MGVELVLEELIERNVWKIGKIIVHRSGNSDNEGYERK